MNVFEMLVGDKSRKQRRGVASEMFTDYRIIPKVFDTTVLCTHWGLLRTDCQLTGYIL